MALRPPPGRAGRIWLARRLAVARRGRDVLDRKRRALLDLQQRLRGLLDEARDEWEGRAAEAEVWWNRAAVLAGERELERAAGAVLDRADVRLHWRNSLGVVYPAEIDVSLPIEEPLRLGGSSALVYAAESHRRALEAAARFGSVRLAAERAEAELRATSRRLRAIERRWLPEHERALRTLELALDEGEREDATRARWVLRRHGRIGG